MGQGLLLRPRQGPRRVGLIGLGTGTLTSYARAGDYFRIYEINPLVVQIADHYFAYLADSKARTEIAIGDARLTLEREQPENFDLLAVDAFSGDSIPVHLLTREAFLLYFRHIKPDGVLAMHVSNRYLNLVPIVDLVARDLRKATARVITKLDGKCYPSSWILLANKAADLEYISRRETGLVEGESGLRIWTDDYSNLFRILR